MTTLNVSKRRAQSINRRARTWGAEGTISRDEIAAVLEQQKGRCFYCHAPMTARTFTVDHVVPLSRGGSNEASNLVAACGECNEAKDNMSVGEFMHRRLALH